MMRPTLALAIVSVLVAGAAHATGATLTGRPKNPTLDACQKWAAEQDEDAQEMWGTKETGGSSPEIAKLRLALSCLGDTPPEIVMFGSSANFDRDFCRRHARAQICLQRR